MKEEQNKTTREQRALIYRAVDENIQRNKWLNQPSKVQELILYVAECEMWGQDTISPSDEYLIKKLCWNPNTNVRNIRYQAKRTQFITTTGRGKNLRYELNQGFLRGKIGELLARKRPSLDMSEFLLLDKRIDKVLDNPLDKRIDIFSGENGSTEPQNHQNEVDNNNSNNNNLGEVENFAGYEIVKDKETETSKPDRKDTSYLSVFALWGAGYPLNWRGNRTEIQSAKNILIEHDLEKAKVALEFYNENKGESWCPTIFSPTDLDRKWVKLQNFRDKLDKQND